MTNRTESAVGSDKPRFGVGIVQKRLKLLANYRWRKKCLRLALLDMADHLGLMANIDDPELEDIKW